MKAILALLTIVAASTFRDWISELWHEPVHHLTCHGQFTSSKNGNNSNYPNTLWVEIDSKENKVLVQHFPAVFKISKSGSELVAFSDPDIVSSGQIGRYTGAISVYMELKPEGWQKFEGLCHKAEPLF